MLRGKLINVLFDQKSKLINVGSTESTSVRRGTAVITELPTEPDAVV